MCDKSVGHDGDDIQARAEWDRILVARLIAHLAPHFIRNKAGCIRACERLQAAVECLYNGHGTAVTATWPDLMLITRLTQDIQGQCADAAHAQDILRLLRFTINWQYQPGVQQQAQDYLRVV